MHTQKSIIFISLHSGLKYLRFNSVQLNRLIRAHFGLLEVTEVHCLEHWAAPTENQFVAFKVLQSNS
jgi:hypothetical protein